MNPWQMTVESGRRRKLGIVLLYRSRLLLTREVENARRGTVSGVQRRTRTRSALSRPSWAT